MSEERELLPNIQALRVLPKLEALHLADLACLLDGRVCGAEGARSVQEQDGVDHGLARLICTHKVIDLELGLSEHGECLDLCEDVIVEAELTYEVEDNFSMFICFVVASEDTGNER